MNVGGVETAAAVYCCKRQSSNVSRKTKLRNRDIDLISTTVPIMHLTHATPTRPAAPRHWQPNSTTSRAADSSPTTWTTSRSTSWQL